VRYSYSCGISILVLLGLSLIACSGSNKNFEPNATLGIQIVDNESKQALEHIQVNLLVGGDILNRKNETYSVPTDIAGRVQFQGLPKSAFSINIQESDKYWGYDTSFTPGAFQVNEVNSLEIFMEEKKTIFAGWVIDVNDNTPIDSAIIEITETSFSTLTDSRGKFTLTAPRIDQKFHHKIKVSKSPGYHSDSKDIVGLKVNEINNMRSISLKRTKEWKAPNFEGKQGRPDTSRSRFPPKIYGSN
jgi:hypothetical protein